MYIDYSAVRIVTIDICNLGHTEFIATHVVCHILQGIFLLHPHASIPIYIFLPHSVIIFIVVQYLDATE